jgi:hypothetical protein
MSSTRSAVLSSVDTSALPEALPQGLALREPVVGEPVNVLRPEEDNGWNITKTLEANPLVSQTIMARQVAQYQVEKAKKGETVSLLQAEADVGYTVDDDGIQTRPTVSQWEAVKANSTANDNADFETAAELLARAAPLDDQVAADSANDTPTLDDDAGVEEEDVQGTAAPGTLATCECAVYSTNFGFGDNTGNSNGFSGDSNTNNRFGRRLARNTGDNIIMSETRLTAAPTSEGEMGFGGSYQCPGQSDAFQIGLHADCGAYCTSEYGPDSYDCNESADSEYGSADGSANGFGFNL